jgi:hypothetical protein
MTSDTPAPSSDAPDRTTEPRRSLAAELLTTTLPATAGTAVTDPKLPPFRGD